MSDPNARFETVNVEQIMAQIRARIRERRGADHADAQIRELAAARLAGLVGAGSARAELVEKLRRAATAAPEGAPVDASPLYGRRGPLRWIRRLLSPILALFLSPKAMMRALGRQEEASARQEQFSAILFELAENLVFETTRLEVEVGKLEMRVESQAARLDFAERRARALEGMIRFRPEQAPEPDVSQRRPAREPERAAQARAPREPIGPAQAGAGGQPQGGRDTEPQGSRDAEQAGGSEARRRRRRRRGRRGGANRAPGEPGAGGAEQAPAGDAHAEPGEPAPAAHSDEAAPVTPPGGGQAPAADPLGRQGPEPRNEEPPTPLERDD